MMSGKRTNMDRNSLWFGLETFHKVFPKVEDFEIIPHQTALLVIDMQYQDAHPDYGLGKTVQKLGIMEEWEYYFARIATLVVPNIQKLQRVCREHRIEIIYPTISSYTEDCRDMSLAYKRTGVYVPLHSKEAEVLDEIKPLQGEIVLKKRASGVFNSTDIDQLLRNLGITTLITTGVFTNYCVENAVRDAGDRGYNVILVDDGCATTSQELHEAALMILRDQYAKIKTTQEILTAILQSVERRAAQQVVR